MKLLLENWRGYLNEATEDELNAIRPFLDRAKPEDLAFNELFDGKKRVLVDFPTFDPTTELGSFIDYFSSLGYEVDWEKGMLSSTRDFRNTNPVDYRKWQKSRGDLTAHEHAIQKPSKVKSRKVQMKIGKWLTKVNDLLNRLLAYDETIKNNLPKLAWGDRHGTLGTPPRDVEAGINAAWAHNPKVAKENYNNFYRIRDQLSMYLTTGVVVMHRHDAAERIAEMGKYWQTNADYIKKHADAPGDDSYSIIITRDPRDVLRMGDFMDVWDSCHRLPSGAAKSRHDTNRWVKCAVAEAHGHGAVAYIVDSKALHKEFGEENAEENINKAAEIFHDDKRIEESGPLVPIGRVRLRQVRYYDHDDALNASFGKGTELAVPEARTYGEDLPPGFVDRVMAWSQENQLEQMSGAPRSTKYEEDVIDLGRFIKFGGSYDDNEIGELLADLFDIQVTGDPIQDTTTEDELELDMVSSIIDQMRAACRELANDWNHELRACEVGFEIKTDVPDGLEDQDPWIKPSAHATISWHVDEWLSLPNPIEGQEALDTLIDTGFSFIADEGGTIFRGTAGESTNKIFVQFEIDPQYLPQYGKNWALTPRNRGELGPGKETDYNDFCHAIWEEVDKRREVFKQRLEAYFIREGAFPGSTMERWGGEILRGQFEAAHHWDIDVEEDGQKIESVTATIYPQVLELGGVEPERVKEIFDSRDFWLEFRKILAAAAIEKVGDVWYPDMHHRVLNEDAGQLEFKMEVTPDDPDGQAEVTLAIVSMWDSAGVDRIAGEIFRQLASNDIAEEMLLLKMDRLLKEVEEPTFDIDADDPTGAPPTGVETPAMRERELEDLLKNVGLEYIQFIGRGLHGVVYEVRDLQTQQRLAAKVTSRQEEVPKHAWLKDNYDSLTPIAKKHFPEIHNIEQVGDQYIITMEYLKKAPQEVVDDLFYSPGFSSSAPPRLAQRREKRFLSTPESVKEVIDYCFDSGMLAAYQAVPGHSTDENVPTIEEMKARVYEEWERGSDPGPPPDEYLDYESQDFWDLYSGKTLRLMNIMCAVWIEAMPSKYTNFREFGVSELAKMMPQIMEKQVVPVHHGQPAGTQYAGAGAGIESAYPEAESIMKAMDYMAEQGFTPMDIHHENVLIRPGTDELVIADLGNFRLGFRQRS